MPRNLDVEIGFSLGSNLGNRLRNLAAARNRLLAYPEARLLAQSAVYETEPVGVRPEYTHLRFLNAVLIINSGLPVEPWLVRLGEVEQALSRVRTADRYAPRTIDIDILYAGNSCIDSGGLVVPHPRWAQRRFVVAPLAEVRPGLILPGAGRTVQSVLASLPPGEACTRLASDW